MYCLKVRDDEQSVMKSGRVPYSKHEAQRRQTLGHQLLRRVTGTSRADKDDDRSRRREVTSATAWLNDFL